MAEIAISNLLLTSAVSGLSSGLGQLALAHALYDFTRAEPDRASQRLLHGEIVGIGLLIQTAFNGRDSARAHETLLSLDIEPSMDTVLPGLKPSRVEAYARFCTDHSVISESELPRLLAAIKAAADSP
jgi:glycerol dehydrogenase-like iron-containing ADH family enzyme